MNFERWKYFINGILRIFLHFSLIYRSLILSLSFCRLSSVICSHFIPPAFLSSSSSSSSSIFSLLLHVFSLSFSFHILCSPKTFHHSIISSSVNIFRDIPFLNSPPFYPFSLTSPILSLPLSFTLF